MSDAPPIEEAVLEFLYRVRVKEKNSPKLQRDALALANRIVATSGGVFGFIELKKLRGKNRENSALHKMVNSLTDKCHGWEIRVADLDVKLANERNQRIGTLTQLREIRNELDEAIPKLKSALAEVAPLKVENENLRQQVNMYRERLEPQKRKKEGGRKLAV